MKNLLSVVIISFLFTCCFGQQLPKEFIKGSVVIYNNTNRKISILLGDSASMETINLKKKDVWLSPVYNFNPIIKIQTQNHIVTYQLKNGNYYMIFWNGKKKYWDLIKTEKRE